MSAIQKAVLLVGSPRGEKSTSTSIVNYISNILRSKEIEGEIFWVALIINKKEEIDRMLKAIDDSDIVLLAVPLYIDSAPYIVIKAMEIVNAYRQDQAKRKQQIFFPIINSGFPERSHFPVAIKIYETFSSSAGFKWIGSLSIGSGEGLQGSKGKSLEEAGNMSKAIRSKLEELVETLAEGKEYRNEYIGVIPEKLFKGFFKFLVPLFLWIGNRHWKRLAKKNGADVMARPYTQ